MKNMQKPSEPLLPASNDYLKVRSDTDKAPSLRRAFRRGMAVNAGSSLLIFITAIALVDHPELVNLFIGLIFIAGIIAFLTLVNWVRTAARWIERRKR